MIGAISETVSNKIRTMSFGCACLVALIHITRHVKHGTGAWWLFALGSETVCRIAVPFFFLISGYLVAGHFYDEGYWGGALKKRMKTILLPYLIVSVLYVIFMMLFERRIISVSLVNLFGINLFATPYLGVLWYLRMLLILIFLLPVVRYFILSDHGVRAGIFVLFVVWMIFKPWSGWSLNCVQRFIIYGVSLEGVAFFFAGAYLRTHPFDVHYKTWVIVSLTCLLVIGRLVALRWDVWYQHIILHASIPFMMLLVWSLMPKKPFLPCLVSLSMPIYLIHKFVILAVSRVLSKEGILGFCETTVLGYVMFYVMVLTITILVCLAMRRFMRPFYRLITGDR